MIDKEKVLEDLIQQKYALEEERKSDPQAYEAKYKAMFDPEKETDETMKHIMQKTQEFFLTPVPPGGYIILKKDV